MKRFLTWLPRVLAVALVVFISLFALDVFSEGYRFWATVLALIIHLIPSLILLAVLVLAWYRKRLGGLLFIALAVFFIFWSRAELSALLMIAGPAIVIGLLFIVSEQVKNIKVKSV